MDHLDAMSALFACTRAIHMAACLLAMAVYFFDRCVVGRDGRHWPRIASRLIYLALPVALISGAGWFACVAINMSGMPPGQALQSENLTTVWNDTQFGRLWKVRAILFVANVIVTFGAIPFRSGSKVRGALMWLGLLLTALLAASLAWAGHGLLNESVSHLACDASHLLVSAVWPVGLLPFAMLLARLRAESGEEKWTAIWELTRRFSNISLASVILLTISGVINSWPLIGGISGLFFTLYGRILLIKVGLFLLMIAIGAVNLFYLMPHMPHRALADRNAVARKMPFRLQINVEAEIFLGALVMLAVGLLGILMPAVEHLLMHHHE